jgi:hypothetical protein
LARSLTAGKQKLKRDRERRKIRKRRKGREGGRPG